MTKKKKFRDWLDNILGITRRKERKKKLEAFLTVAEQTKNKLVSLHNQTLTLCDQKKVYERSNTKG